MASALIVEDNVLNRIGLMEEVHWPEFGIDQVLAAENGEEGLRLLRSARPAVALVDVEMPLLDGLEMARRARAEGLDTRIVFVSSYDKMEYVRSAMKLGAMDYIFKPVQLGELYAALRRVLADYQGQRTRREKVERTFSTLRHALRESAPTQELMQRLSALERSLDGMDAPEAAQAESEPSSARQKEIVARIQSAIETRYASAGTLDHLLDGLYISQSYANHVYKRAVGVPIYAALQQRRIRRAQELMAEGSMKIGEIASAVGYATPSHFTLLFKQYTGLTPGEYMKRLKKGAGIQG